jgi:pilus assembly protein CpaC
MAPNTTEPPLKRTTTDMPSAHPKRLRYVWPTALLVIAIQGSLPFMTIVRAQSLAPQPATAAHADTDAAVARSARGPIADAGTIDLVVGRSTIVRAGATIQRVSLTSADIADAQVTSATDLLINGKAPGTISMFVWDRAGSVNRYQIVVQRNFDLLSEQLKEFFPQETIKVATNGRNALLSGTVSSKDVAEKAVSLAATFVDKKEEVVSLLQVREGGPSNQVLLKVRFAEVSRNALTELGATLYGDGFNNTIGRITTQQFAAPSFDQNGAQVGKSQVFSDFLNLFLFDYKNQLGVVIKALQTKGLFQSLAEPNLVAESGKEASFLAGGEFPIPVAQGAASAVAVSIQFKEFGVRLNFTPTVIGDRVHLKVRPEVSSLDFTNAVVLQGFRIPALTTRRTETEIELQSGQTFAVSGLLNNAVTSTLKKIPGIGDVPVLGLLFQSKAAQKDLTELVVMITPEILPAGSPGLTTSTPRMPEQFLKPLTEKQSVPMPPPAFPDPQRSGANVDATTPGPTQTPDVRLKTDPTPTPVTTSAQDATSSPAVVDSPASDVAQADQRQNATETKPNAKQAEAQRRAEKAEHERQEKAAHEQLKRDAKAAQEAKVQAEKQAVADKQHQKALDDAAARLKAAQDAYQTEADKDQAR